MVKLATLIFKHFPLVTFLVGFVLVVGGAAGGWTFWQINLPIDSEVWRWVIGLFGAGLIIAAFRSYLEESRRPSTRPLTIAAPKDFKPELYPVVITAPKDRAGVEAPFKVEGRCETLPSKGYELWLFLTSHANDQFFPHRMLDLRVEGRMRGYKWEATVNVTRWNPGDTRRFQVYLVGPNGQKLVSHYRSVGQEFTKNKYTERWPPLLNLTDDTIPCGSPCTVIVTGVASSRAGSS